jgi:GNAT superfamily N-acetyltransferase
MPNDRPTIDYRNATVQDIPELVRLRINFLREFAIFEGDETEMITALELYLSERLQLRDYINPVALHDGKIVATGGVHFYSLLPNFFNFTGAGAYIQNIYTLAPYRRRGIAKEIFKLLMQEVAAKGAIQVSLHASEAGRGLYEQFGFKKREGGLVLGLHV